MKCFMNLLSVLLLLLSSTNVRSDDVQGCGGYVKSDVEINFAQVGIKLYTAQGSLKYETECAPNDGYYFMPVYDKGKYVIKVAPPPGWSVEPTEVAVTLDGETDACSMKEDINFHFKGFAVMGQVSSSGGGNREGPAGVEVSLHRGSVLVQSRQSGEQGHFVFTPLAAGTYTVSVTHPNWNFISRTSTVSISDQNGEVSAGSLVVRGYGVTGTVLGEGTHGVAGVVVLMRVTSDQDTIPEHYKKYSPGCKTELPEGYTISATADSGTALCYAVTDSKGLYSFTDIVPGQYSLSAHHHTPLTTFVMLPDAVPVTVGHDDAGVKQTFKLYGFSVHGRVLKNAGGAGVAGATVVLVKTSQTATTASDGSYVINNVKTGKYTITVAADALEFSSTIVSVSAASPTVAAIMPSHYSCCFRVVLDRAADAGHTAWAVLVSGSVGESSSVLTGKDGRGCLMLPLGDYRVTVQLTSQQQDQGIRFGPPEHVLSVSGPATKELVFSQFLGEVRATVTCLEDCPLTALTLLLRATDGTARSATAAAGGNKLKTAIATWKEVVPGKYQVQLQKEDWCWSQNSIQIEVNTENVEVSFFQSGYLLTLTSSHEITLPYSVQGSKSSSGTVEVQKGTTKTCLSIPGVYTFTPDSCHKFSSSSYKWESAEPSLVSLVATHHTVTASVQASQPGDFKLLVAHQDESSTVLKPKQSYPNNVYLFELLVKEKEQITFTPQSADNLFQYQPTSFPLTVESNCMSDVVLFKAEKALFIDGKVTPAVAGVEITVEAEDQRHVFVTDKDGKYKAGPLDNSLDYTIKASLTGYTLKEIDTDGNFEALKLAEVIVDIQDEDEKSLSSVVVSMSGGKSYRQNSLTRDDGVISFNSLLPGEYFLRFAMKEYNFQPATKMVTVEQGATIKINVSGVRVAYSAIGESMSLTGVLEPDVAVEARGVGERCSQYQEEAVSDAGGVFRIRGLLPKCEYNISLKTGEGFNKHIERMLPASTRVKVEKQDIIGLRLVVLRYFNQMDVVGTVDAPKEHLHTISIKVYREDVSDSPVHTVKITNHPFFMLPPMIADGKTYTLHLESTLSLMQYTYRTTEVSFTADSSFKHLKLNFRPTMRTLDAEMNRNTMAGLLLAIIVIAMMANYQKIAPGIEWCAEIISNMLANRAAAGHQGPVFSDNVKRARAKARKMS
uniref:Nodal modulator 3-like n=1 Tax=Hirondellea gigas TaxID=1518452 RepID=A0A2P2I1N0_9CRUS